jgi:hypothetical protein
MMKSIAFLTMRPFPHAPLAGHAIDHLAHG